MISKKLKGCVICGAAAAVLAFAPAPASAQDASAPMMSSQATAPVAVTGTVVRYYVDRSGYVTAMDVQTANGVQMVRFAPGMGQRLYSTYPVGGQATVYVVGSPETSWSVVGMGATAPTGTLSPYTVSDIELLESDPYILAGTKMVTRSGRLSSMIVNDRGEVVGFVLDNNILVRTPREARNIAPGHSGTERVSGLFKGANVEVTGYPEAPRFGVLSSFADRIAANALVVNGKAVGSIGIPMMSREQSKSLLDVNIGGADKTPEELRAAGMGYTTYMPMSSAAGTAAPSQ